MIIRNELRPTMIRTNARYRGHTESHQYSNYIGEAIHDLKLLGKVMDYNENDPTEFVGHSNYILNNMAASVSGATRVKSTIPDAATLVHVKDDVVNTSGAKIADLLNTSTWSAYGGCTKSMTNGVMRLVGAGTQTPCGIGTQLMVEEGQIIFIRLGVKLISGNGSSFGIGSHNINRNTGDMKDSKLVQNGGIIFIDKRLYCKHREPITINIDLQYLPDKLAQATVEITDLEIRYATENELSLGPLDTLLKPRVNLLEEQIKNIIRNI